MAIKKSIRNIILALIMTLSLLASSSGSVLAKKDRTPRINPDFQQLVQAYPDAMFKVIVQKDAKNKDLKANELETGVVQGKGKLRKQLGMVVSFSAEMSGKEIAKLAKNPKVRWISPDAPVISSGVKPGTYIYRDEFSQRAFNGSNGTKDWTGTPWVEFGEGDGAFSGGVQAKGYSCVSSYCLRLRGYPAGSWGVYRAVDLGQPGSSTLSFKYKRVAGTTTGSIQLQISADGGSSWNTLNTFDLNTSDSGYQTAQYDIAPYANANTLIQFIASGTFSSDLFIDDLEIEYSNPSPYRAIVGADNLSLDGQGVTVAVVDSGVSDHVDLRSDAAGPNDALNSGSRVTQNVTFGNSAPNDEYAHGTHVAGIVAGNGAASNGRFKGIAPGVNLINIRVSNNEGLTYTSDLIDSLQWIYTNKDAYNIRVVNLSINSTMPESYQQSPLDAAVEILWFNGIVVVVSAGNNGTATGPSTVFPPANDPFVITVGALEDLGTIPMEDDFVGDFSAYNITEDGFAKPDLVAPGRNLISLLAGSSATGYTGHLKHHVNEYYFRMSGTSMAAPVVSGAVALLLQDEPGLTPDQVK